LVSKILLLGEHAWIFVKTAPMHRRAENVRGQVFAAPAQAMLLLPKKATAGPRFIPVT